MISTAPRGLIACGTAQDTCQSFIRGFSLQPSTMFALRIKMTAADLHGLYNHLPIIGFAVGLLLLFAATVCYSHRGLVLASMLVLLISVSGAMVAQLAVEPADESVKHYQDIFTNPIRFFANLSSITTFIAVVVTAVICGATVWAGTKRSTIRRSEFAGKCTNDTSISRRDRD